MIGMMTKVCLLSLFCWVRLTFTARLFWDFLLIVLTWVSIYWFSRAGPAASIRIYYEMEDLWGPGVIPINIKHVPIGISYFPQEGYLPPRS